MMDINTNSGAKVTGKINTWQKLLSLPIADRIETPKAEWFKLSKSALLTDVSKWNGVINWDLMRSKADGFIVRAGYGTRFDKQWSRNMKELCNSPGHIRGVYWYYNTGATWIQQADYITEALEPFDPELFALDIEGAFNVAGKTFRNDPLKILREVQRRRPDVQTLFYTNQNIWENWLMSNVDYLEFQMWLAWYPWFPERVQYPILPKNVSYENIYMWQYSADRNGRGREFGADSDAIDLNRTRDTKDEVFADLKQRSAERPEIPILGDLKITLDNQSVVYADTCQVEFVRSDGS